MKMLLVVFVATLVNSISFAQTVDLKFDGQYVIFQKVINVDSASASDLYKRCDRWVTKTFKSPDKVVKARLENEEIRGEGFDPDAVALAEGMGVYGNLRYTFKIEVKENRVRITIYEMEITTSGMAGTPIEHYLYKKDGSERDSKQSKGVKEGATKTANYLILSLEQGLRENSKKGDDW